MHAWADGTTEPSTWNVNEADSSAVLQAAGYMGLRAFLNSSVTNGPIVTSFDDWNVSQAYTTVRNIAYSYDGLQRLLTATETGASSNVNGYTYDNMGNRLTSTVNGTTTTRTYNAANQVNGWTYDLAGNLDGTTASTYDALNRVLTRSGTSFVYNGDGTLVRSGTTNYTQDLASPLSQILSDDSTTYLYGRDRLANIAGSVRTWYIPDALGSVRATMNDNGVIGSVLQYDPWGQVQSGSVGLFGYTGELQQGTSVYLRARWYNAGAGTLYGRDPFTGMPEMPYSLQYYQYGYSNAMSNTDPSGLRGKRGDSAGGTNPRRSNPIEYPLDIGVIIGVSGSGAIGGVIGAASGGAEQVFDLYDFESAYFSMAGGQAWQRKMVPLWAV